MKPKAQSSQWKNFVKMFWIWNAFNNSWILNTLFSLYHFPVSFVSRECFSIFKHHIMISSSCYEFVCICVFVSLTEFLKSIFFSPGIRQAYSRFFHSHSYHEFLLIKLVSSARLRMNWKKQEKHGWHSKLDGVNGHEANISNAKILRSQWYVKQICAGIKV